jgi:sulfite reductase (NADPH) flavoprotein alpha-component
MPTPKHSNIVSSVCPYCGVGCGMILYVDGNKIVKVEGDRSHPANQGKLCTKGANCAIPVPADDRLTQAHVRRLREEKPTAVPLAEAIRTTAQRLKKIIELHGPDAVSFYVSGQLSLEAQYLSNKLCKGFIGTNNIDSNSRLCMSSAASGYKLSLGADGPPGSYRDFEKTNCFFVIGSNMAECHPILFLRMMAAKKESGAKLIVVDPRKTPTGAKADLYLAIEPGTDLALLNGLLHLFVENGHVDADFIARHTEGWPDMVKFLKEYTPARVSELTGLREEDIRTAAKWMGEAKELMTLWTMGLNQSTHGTWNTNAICNLHLATGKICRPGSGPFSLTGQPNAMGGREVGYLSHGLPGQRMVAKAEDRAFIEKLWNVPPGTIRPEPGSDAVHLFKRMQTGEVKAVWIIGTNPVASMPRRSGVIDALKAAELVVVQDVYHPTETSQYADVLLPGALWAEAEGVMINSERNVTLMQKAIEPPGEACADWDLIARVAREMGYAGFDYTDASQVFDEIRQTANPHTGYDLRGISYERLRHVSMQWPCGPQEESGRAIRYLSSPASSSTPEIHFPTESGKAYFFPRPHLPPAELPDEEFPFILNTGRCAHQWHTMTKTGKVPALNKLNASAFLEIHPEDAETLGVQEGDAVEVKSRRGRAVYPARVTVNIRPGCCFAPIHWNDLFGENLAVNETTSEAIDPISKQPEFKFCAVQIAKVAAPAEPTPPMPTLESAVFDPQFALSMDGPFTFEQKEYLQGLISGLIAAGRGSALFGRGLSAEAPFSVLQRMWFNGAFAGAFGAAPVPMSHSDGTAPRPSAAARV